MPRFYRSYDHPILLVLDLLITLVIDIVCFLIKVVFQLVSKIVGRAFWLLGWFFGFLRSPYMKRQFSAMGSHLSAWMNKGMAVTSRRWHNYKAKHKRNKHRYFADAACTIECEEPTF